MPPFAAKVLPHRGQRVGLIRVYESADTPHIVGGAVYVREVATDRKASKTAGDPYAPRGIRNQELLARLVQRGADARARVERLLHPDSTPWISDTLALKLTRAANAHRVFDEWWIPEPAVILRAVPLTTPLRMQDWAVSSTGADALRDAVLRLTHHGKSDEPLRAQASGLTITAHTRETTPVAPDGDSLAWHAVASTDAAGLVGLKVTYANRSPDRRGSPLTLNGMRRVLIEPLIRSAAWMLESSEFYGRVELHLLTGQIGETFQVEVDGIRQPIAGLVPLGGDIALPSEVDPDQQAPLPADLEGLARQWTEDLARASGHLVLRGDYTAD